MGVEWLYSKGTMYLYSYFMIDYYVLILFVMSFHVRIHYGIAYQANGPDFYCLTPLQTRINFARIYMDMTFSVIVIIVAIGLACLIKKGLAVAPFIYMTLGILCLCHLILTIVILMCYLHDPTKDTTRAHPVHLIVEHFYFMFFKPVYTIGILGHIVFLGLTVMYALKGSKDE